jgi:hypothetical protein
MTTSPDPLEHASGEERKGGTVMVPDVEPQRVPSPVGLLEGNVHVLVGTRAAKVDTGTTHWTADPLLVLYREMEKKYLQSSKWGSIPRNPSHNTMKAAMCWILFGLRCCSSSP